MARTFAVIPAAGKSTRMGRPKLALPLGAKSVLERVVDALTRAGVDGVLVVLGPHVADLARIASTARVHLLDHETADMRATVEEGLSWIAKHWNPTDDDGWLLLPADHPTLDSAVVCALLDARRQSQGRSLFVPTYQGQRGHPTWVAWKHLPALQAFRKDAGLNQFFRSLTAETQEVPLTSPSVLWDLDTPEDYEKALAYFKTT